MSIQEKLQHRLSEFIIEPVNLDNLEKYENIFFIPIKIIFLLQMAGLQQSKIVLRRLSMLTIFRQECANC